MGSILTDEQCWPTYSEGCGQDCIAFHPYRELDEFMVCHNDLSTLTPTLTLTLTLNRTLTLTLTLTPTLTLSLTLTPTLPRSATTTRARARRRTRTS